MISVGTGTVADASVGHHPVTVSQVEAMGTPTNTNTPGQMLTGPSIMIQSNPASTRTSGVRASELLAKEDYENISLRVAQNQAARSPTHRLIENH